MPQILPSYRLHKGTGQALVQIAGRRLYLGKYDSPESHERYRRTIAEFLATGSVAMHERKSHAEPLTINELVLRFFDYAQRHYVKEGQMTDEVDGIRAALRRLRRLYGRTPAREFGPKAYQLVRQAMVQEKLSRSYVNGSMERIRRMFRWGATEELLPITIYQTLAAVPGLRRGRSAATETEPVLPVEDDVLAATLPHLPPIVADMVRLQRLCGCRPQEVCLLRPCDIDRSGDVWQYRPRRHKNEHRCRLRVILLGPQAQQVLEGYATGRQARTAHGWRV